MGFSAAYREPLSMLKGDQGARAILERERDRLVLIEVDDPGIHFDIDLPDDWPTEP